MATLKIIENTCTYPDPCKSSVTCEVFGEDGASRGRFCTRHGQKVVNETASEELNGKKAHRGIAPAQGGAR